MGQEISQQNKCITSRRHHHHSQNHHHHNQQQQQQALPQQRKSFPPQHIFQHPDFNNNHDSSKKLSTHPLYSSSNHSNHKHAKHKELIYTSSSISNASSTDDDAYYRQKYNLAKQTCEKSKVSKQLGSRKSLDSHSSTSDYQSSAFGTADELYHDIKINKHQRKNSQSTDSGIYYSSCQCTPTRFSSAASITSGGTSVVSSKSNKSLQKQKEYLDHHLYIKSYLDILEEDQKAKAQYKIAKPGGIRNYTPKILSDVALSTSAPVAATGFAKQSSTKIKDDPWI